MNLFRSLAGIALVASFGVLGACGDSTEPNQSEAAELPGSAGRVECSSDDFVSESSLSHAEPATYEGSAEAAVRTLEVFVPQLVALLPERLPSDADDGFRLVNKGTGGAYVDYLEDERIVAAISLRRSAAGGYLVDHYSTCDSFMTELREGTHEGHR